MPDFLLELRSEEIPARMQAGARADLERLFRAQMDEAGVATGDVTVWSTPRRLALIAKDLPTETQAVREEAKGPPEGAPDQAIDGFCRKNGVSRDDLELRDVKGRMTYFAVKDVPGRAVRDVLAEAIPAIVRAFPWPKSMRWGAASISTESLRWVRPLSGIVAILGEELVECEVEGIASGFATMGHRFHHEGPITIGGADDYADKLRACHVIVDHEERQDLIRDGAAKAAADAGLTLVEDEGLVIENAGLTEWPVPLLGRFDEDFLEVPPEVIQLTARVNQKYFVCEDEEGKLANAFVCTANIEAADGGEAIVAGNRKVLAARLADARFFWEQDLKTPLAEHLRGLERITFHEKLGTVADKVERVAKLARWLVEEGIVSDTPLPGGEGPGVGSPMPQAKDAPTQPSPDRGRASLADLAEQAARLAKADLVTEMVGEFPELQGLMGGYYARAEGLPDEVADAIRDHYKPVGQGDDVPTAPVTVAVSLADKLDTILSFFAIAEFPTGSKDPFALRRAALGVLSLLNHNSLRLKIRVQLVARWYYFAGCAASSKGSSGIMTSPVRGAVKENFGPERVSEWFNYCWDDWQREPLHHAFDNEVVALEDATLDFFADRLKVQQREAGVRHDLIDAVFALGGEDDLVRLLARVHALQDFIGTEDGANLLAAYKRAANILKKEGFETAQRVPAQAGTQGGAEADQLDSRLRGNAEGSSADGVPKTADEDPMENVDDPQMREIYAQQAREQREKIPLSYSPEPAEKDLIDALDAAGPKAAEAVAAEDFTAAMAALASLRAPIDAFFDSVTVNDEDEAKRAARLALLDRFRAAVHNVADFSKIEG